MTVDGWAKASEPQVEQITVPIGAVAAVMNENPSPEIIDIWIDRQKKEIAKLEAAPYYRGLALELADARMFLSIWEETKRRNPQTTEEHHQILKDHGWTIGKSDESIS